MEFLLLQIPQVDWSAFYNVTGLLSQYQYYLDDRKMIFF